MYPGWPESDADLVPLPKCDGPKLKPFDFQGPQQIEFLEFLGEGTHARAFKVKILGEMYALKLFRFLHEGDWLGPPVVFTELDDRQAFSAFYNHLEPFSAECRAYGRLQEAGHEELAIRCFGYVLLDEEHEQAMKTKFGDAEDIVNFNGPVYECGGNDNRERFPCKDGRDPPIRGIVKALGREDEKNLRAPVFRKILRDIKKLQKLGIMHVDIATRQILDDKISDFSTSITTPHFQMTPELNPHLTPEMISCMEVETFSIAKKDYIDFDAMMQEWHKQFPDEPKISVGAFPDALNCGLKYNLRNKAARERLYTFVDPRKYDWTGTSGETDTNRRRSARVSKSKRGGVSPGMSSTIRPKLKAKGPVWRLDSDSTMAERLGGLRRPLLLCNLLEYTYKEGFIVPVLEGHWYARHKYGIGN